MMNFHHHRRYPCGRAVGCVVGEGENGQIEVWWIEAQRRGGNIWKIIKPEVDEWWWWFLLIWHPRNRKWKNDDDDFYLLSLVGLLANKCWRQNLKLNIFFNRAVGCVVGEGENGQIEGCWIEAQRRGGKIWKIIKPEVDEWWWWFLLIWDPRNRKWKNDDDDFYLLSRVGLLANKYWRQNLKLNIFFYSITLASTRIFKSKGGSTLWRI